MLHVVVFPQIERQDVGRTMRAQQPVEGAMTGVKAHLWTIEERYARVRRGGGELRGTQGGKVTAAAREKQ